MKILNIKNMAEFLPRYPEHRIVLFDESPEIISKPHTLHTSAKLWYNFSADAMIGEDIMTEKGGIIRDRATSIAVWLQSAISEPSE